MHLDKEGADGHSLGLGLWKSPAVPPEQMNPLALAYIGDAVFEVYVRQFVLSMSNHRPHVLHKRSSSYVSAKAQAKALEMITPFLTEDEADIVRRGRNAKSGTAPKNTDIIEYRNSTALESLIGYLYYLGRYERLTYVLEQSVKAVDQDQAPWQTTLEGGKEDEGGRTNSR